MNGQKMEKWINWIQNHRSSLINEITDLCHKKQVFLGLAEIVDGNNNLNKDGIFLRSVDENYYECLIIGIRRLMKPDEKSISLMELLEDMEENNTLISRKFYRTIDLGASDIVKEISLVNIFGKNECIQKKEISSYIQRLKKYEFIIIYADDKIAHLGKKKLKKPTIEEAHRALDLIEEIIKRYVVVLTGRGFQSFTPVIQGNWKKVFDKPWR